MIESSRLGWWITENISIGWTVPHWDNISCAWSGHQPLLTGQTIISKINSAVATCKREITVFPWWKGKPFLLSTVIQNSVNSRRDKMPPSPCVQRNSIYVEQRVQWFSKSPFKTMWMSQGSGAQVCKHNVVCPVHNQTAGFLRKVAKFARMEW